jgi:uncharacterized protein (DUF362 family)/Pyruvate/2-oxoacid:ferredoxin oxidoreductase delta subunit
MNKVSLVKCNDYNFKEVKTALLESFNNLGGIGKYIKKDMQIALKPNLLMPCNPNSAATTDPIIIHALSDLILKEGAHVSIVESPGGPYIKANLRKVYKTCRIENITQKANIALNYDLDVEMIRISEGQVLKKIEIIKPLLEADLVINLPKLKTHSQMTYTGAVKNMFGAVPGVKKAEYHFRMSQYDYFANALIDIFLSVKPGLSIMDAVIGMDGYGPSAGNPKRLGFIAASENAFDLDFTCLHIVGIKPESVPITKQAIKRGLCSSDIKQIELCGEELNNIRISAFNVPKAGRLSSINFTNNRFYNLMLNILKPKPVFNHKICTGCEICANNCPAKIITVKNRHPKLNLSKCIRCFSCKELCPQHAVTIKKLPAPVQSVLNTLFLILPMLVPRKKK